MLSKQKIRGIFEKAKAIITDNHFVYAKKPDGWYHGSDYVNKDAIYPFVDLTSSLCMDFAEHFQGHAIYSVVGPTMGGARLADWTTHWLQQFLRRTVYSVCADEEDVLADSQKIGTRRIIKRGQGEFVKGTRCLIVEDVINSGATVVKTRDAILQAGGDIVGVACLCNRSGGKVTAATLGAPELFSLLDLDMKMFKEDECPICKEKGQNTVRLDLGKGKEFLVRKNLTAEAG